MKTKQNTKQQKAKKPTGLIVAVSILGAVTLGVSGFALWSSVQNASYKNQLNTIYQKGYYDFYDAINNTEVKMNKIVSTTDKSLAKKYLMEISKNADEAQQALNNLPISTNGLEKSLTFINQVGGYTQTLANKLDKGGSLSQDDKATLLKLNSSVADMRRNLTKMTNQMNGGYDILSNSIKLDGDYNNFTLSLKNMNASDIEYPSMIYDGPFADSQTKRQVKGLNEQKVDKETAQNNLSKLVNVAPEKLVYKSENKGRIECFNFEWQDASGYTFFAQMTQKGGRLLSLNSQKDRSGNKINLQEAQTIAKQFLAKNGMDDVECVWYDTIEGNMYLNFAPVQNGVILYPDLVKLKIDLADGMVLGFEATSYFTNHTDRTLGNFAVTKQQAEEQIDSQYKIQTTKKALAPIDYAEVLCWEVKANYSQSTYYFYIDAQSGQMVNVLKVVKTNDGSKLM